MKHRTGDALNYVQHPVGIRKPLTAEHLKRGDITNLIAVKVDERTTIYIKQGQDVEQALARWHKRNLECLKITFGKPIQL